MLRRAGQSPSTVSLPLPLCSGAAGPVFRTLIWFLCLFGEASVLRNFSPSSPLSSETAAAFHFPFPSTFPGHRLTLGRPGSESPSPPGQHSAFLFLPALSQGGHPSGFRSGQGVSRLASGCCPLPSLSFPSAGHVCLIQVSSASRSLQRPWEATYSVSPKERPRPRRRGTNKCSVFVFFFFSKK